mmetsp:Transcript_26698/g.68566  ORF Transcript_26698/g.68566 Transcript_26698/m.68566 type:complete len:226 (-) Transcript_26698:67-744(-)
MNALRKRLKTELAVSSTPLTTVKSPPCSFSLVVSSGSSACHLAGKSCWLMMVSASLSWLCTRGGVLTIREVISPLICSFSSSAMGGTSAPPKSSGSGSTHRRLMWFLKLTAAACRICSCGSTAITLSTQMPKLGCSETPFRNSSAALICSGFGVSVCANASRRPRTLVSSMASLPGLPSACIASPSALAGWSTGPPWGCSIITAAIWTRAGGAVRRPLAGCGDGR